MQKKEISVGYHRIVYNDRVNVGYNPQISDGATYDREMFEIICNVRRKVGPIESVRENNIILELRSRVDLQKRMNIFRRG